MNPAIAVLSTKLLFFMLSATISLAKLLESAAVIYLFSMSDIFAS